MNKENPTYYAVIPANVRYDNTISSSTKLFYGEITALSSKTGDCWASNSYFSKLYEVSPSTISSWVKKLEKAGYISVKYEREGKQITKRILKLRGGQNIDNPIQSGQKINRGVINKSVEGGQNIKGGWSENLQENTINSNTIKDNIINSNSTGVGCNKDFIENKILDVFINPEYNSEDKIFNNALEDYKELGMFEGISEIMEWDESQKTNWNRTLSRIENLYINQLQDEH